MEDSKAIVEQIKTDLANAQNEAKAAKEQSASLEKKLSEKETEINNLDKSVKSMAETIESLKKMAKEAPKALKQLIREDLEAKKDSIREMMSKGSNFAIEVKLGTGDITLPNVSSIPGTGLSLQGGGTVHAAPILSNAFLVAFAPRAINASRLQWVEATDNKKNVGYVEELAVNNNESAVKFSEKQRKFAKVATFTVVSSEMDQWFEFLVDFAVNRVNALLLEDIDTKLYNGQGNDSTKQKEVYGLKASATAFAALGKYDAATVADVILDAIAQVKKAGYNANVAIVPFAVEATLRGLKNGNNNYMYNEVTGMFGPVRILPSGKIGDGEILVADNSCVETFLGSTIEIEWTRQASTDSWRVDFRRLVQVKVPTAEAKGLILVADIDTAIAAITKSVA